MEDMIEDSINNLLDQYLVNGTSIDWNNLTAVASKGLGAPGKLARGDARWELETKGANVIGSVKFRLDQLTKAIQEMADNQMENASVLQNRLEQLENIWSNIANELHFDNSIGNKKMIYWGEGVAKISDGKGHKISTGQISGAGVSFVESLNALWTEFKQEVASYVQGQLGEYYASMALATAGKVGAAAEAELLEFIENGLTNSLVERTGFDQEVHGIALHNVITHYWNKKGDKFVAQDGLMSTSGGTLQGKQGKVDISVTLPELGATNLNLSVKNYANNAQTIHIHSGSSILMLMQQYSDFMNHYLNITTSHNVAYINGKRKVFGGSGGGRSVDITMMKQLLKISLLAHGLIGEYTTFNGLGSKAEVMVVNKGGIWKVYYMQDIINALLQNPALGEIEGFDSFNPVSIWHQSKAGPNYSDAYSRITALLTSLNNFKLSMSINVNALI